MFADVDGNAEVDAGDSVLGQRRPSPHGVTVIGNRPVEQYLRFDYLGQARMVSGALQMGTIEVCKSRLRGYRVVLANSGSHPHRSHARPLSVKPFDSRSSRLARRVQGTAAACSRPPSFDRVPLFAPGGFP